MTFSEQQNPTKNGKSFASSSRGGRRSRRGNPRHGKPSNSSSLKSYAEEASYNFLHKDTPSTLASLGEPTAKGQPKLRNAASQQRPRPPKLKATNHPRMKERPSRHNDLSANHPGNPNRPNECESDEHSGNHSDRPQSQARMSSLNERIPKRDRRGSDSSHSNTRTNGNKKRKSSDGSDSDGVIDLLDDDDDRKPAPSNSQTEVSSLSMNSTPDSRQGASPGNSATLTNSTQSRTASLWNEKPRRSKRQKQNDENDAVSAERELQRGAIAKRHAEMATEEPYQGEDTSNPQTETADFYCDNDTSQEEPQKPQTKKPRQNDSTNVRAVVRAAVKTATTAATTVAETAAIAYNALTSPKNNSNKPRKRKSIRPGESLQNEANRTKPSRQKTRGVQPFAFSLNSENKTPPARRRNPSRKASSSAKRQETELIEIIDSDSDDEDQEQNQLTEYDTVRISIGSEVMRSSCRLLFDRTKSHLTIHFQRQFGRQTRSGGCSQPKEHSIKLPDDAEELVYFRSSTDDDDDDMISFLSITATEQLSKALKGIKDFHQGDTIAIELRDNTDLDRLVQDLVANDLEVQRIEDRKLAADFHCEALLKDSNNERKERLSLVPTQKKNYFIEGKDEEDVLLIYPFAGDPMTMENGARQFQELGANPLEQEDLVHHKRKDGEKGSGRGHFLTIQVSDYQRLEPEQYLNDTLIDFWMKWITRKDPSDLHVFSTHFFNTLVDKGIDGVKSWTERKQINVFQKKFVFFPINKSLHWSLAVAVNPGSIKNTIKSRKPDDNEQFPCILFFDSLKAHSRHKAANNIRKWLNYEWKRINAGDDDASENESEPFTKESMVVIAPKVPYQENGWDCGVFVCRYAFAMYQLRIEPFIAEQFENTSKGVGGVGATELITNSEAFNFCSTDIVRIREEITKFIEHLSVLYQSVKSEEKAEKRRAKERKKLDEEKQRSESPTEAEDECRIVERQPSLDGCKENRENYATGDEDLQTPDSKPLAHPTPFTPSASPNPTQGTAAKHRLEEAREENRAARPAEEQTSEEGPDPLSAKDDPLNDSKPAASQSHSTGVDSPTQEDPAEEEFSQVEADGLPASKIAVFPSQYENRIKTGRPESQPDSSETASLDDTSKSNDGPDSESDGSRQSWMTQAVDSVNDTLQSAHLGSGVDQHEKYNARAVETSTAEEDEGEEPRDVCRMDVDDTELGSNSPNEVVCWEKEDPPGKLAGSQQSQSSSSMEIAAVNPDGCLMRKAGRNNAKTKSAPRKYTPGDFSADI